MKKRKTRRYRGGKRPRGMRGSGKNSVMKFIGIIGIIMLAVFCGYGTARFVLAPILGYDTEVLKLDFPSKISTSLDTLISGSDTDKASESKENKETNYALQFGVFDNRDGAETLKSELEKDGVKVQIKEQDGRYKVISDLIDTKEQALSQLEDVKTASDKDVFITTVN